MWTAAAYQQTHIPSQDDLACISSRMYVCIYHITK